ncbi:GNAT family N-acetyltransferase [Thermoactinospora rubra]|uniref:GNAT family N-acetyltransferase n=1 Tax=Thermoactinospora rubra TaxID=1088767 RepID=UPI00197D6FD7|nr:GNAT family N-acetyltransferase [Thermoactinospora rubra]
MLSLRPATADDVEAIATIWHRGWVDGHLGQVPEALYHHRRPADFRERVPARIGVTTVATIDAEVVGFVTVIDDEIEQLYVAAPARGTGVAAALLRHGEETIASRFGRAWLAVVAGNARARRFYTRHGWHDAGAIDYLAQTESGTVPVPSRRYEKDLTTARESR